jgi:hypothetical protein
LQKEIIKIFATYISAERIKGGIVTGANYRGEAICRTVTHTAIKMQHQENYYILFNI